MSYVVILGLALTLAWLTRRHFLLRRGVDDLAEAIKNRQPYLSEEADLARGHVSWRHLASHANALVDEFNRLGRQKAGQLAQLETTLGNLQEAVFIVDHDNYILLANNALKTMFPGSREILGQRLESVLHSAELLSFIDEVWRGGAVPRREIEFAEPAGSVWIEATGALIPGEDGNNGGAWSLFVLHDITRQKHLELVRTEFVANVSHELKTPLSVVRGFAETVVEDDGAMSENERDEFIGAIYRHAVRLSDIVEDLLTLSRLESGHSVMQATVHELSPFLASVVDEAKPQLEESGHQIKLFIEVPAGTHVVMDKLRLGMVFGNLVDNARKYTPRGSIVEIGARLLSETSEIEFWVRDNGAGIPTADLPRIFERFYRVEKGRAREKGGTGLGLSIVKRIVQLHGGRVWGESNPGAGTRIGFVLPLPRPPAEADRNELNNGPASATARESDKR